MIAVLMGGDDFKSSLFLLIGANCSREAHLNFLTGREGDTYSHFSHSEVPEVIFLILSFTFSLFLYISWIIVGWQTRSNS